MKHLLQVAAIALLIQGCAALEKPFHKVIVIPETIVHIKNTCDGAPGWAQDGEICVWGYEHDGIITPDYGVLGHEVGHLLNFADSAAKNPDKHTNPLLRPID